MATPQQRKLIKKCLICGYERGIDNAHIFPVLIIKQLVGIFFEKSKKLKYKPAKHTLILCKNCHWAYDHFLLNKDEFEKIKMLVVSEMTEMQEIFKKQFLEGKIGDDKLVADFSNWSNKFDKFVGKLYGGY